MAQALLWRFLATCERLPMCQFALLTAAICCYGCRYRDLQSAQVQRLASTGQCQDAVRNQLPAVLGCDSQALEAVRIRRHRIERVAWLPPVGQECEVALDLEVVLPNLGSTWNRSAEARVVAERGTPLSEWVLRDVRVAATATGRELGAVGEGA